MQYRTLASSQTIAKNALRRFPWALDRGVQRYVLGRRDHRDATVMASSEPVVSFRTACYLLIELRPVPFRPILLAYLQVLSCVTNGIGVVTLNR